MLLGRSVVSWLLIMFVAICVYLIALWLIPLAFGFLDVTIPLRIVRILSLLIAFGVVFGARDRLVL